MRTIAERFQQRAGLLSLLLWIAIAIGPAYFVSDTYQDFVWRYFTPGDPDPQVRAYALVATQVTFLAFLEACLIRLAALLCLVPGSVPRVSGAHTIGRGLRVVVVTSAIVYQSCIVVSWVFFSQTGRFLQLGELWLLRFSIDLTFLRTVVTLREWTWLFGAVSLAAVSALFLCKASSRMAEGTAHAELRHWTRLTAIFASVVLAFRVLLPCMASPELFTTIRANAADCIAPQLSLLWSSVLYRTRPEAFHAVPLELHPRDSFDSYLQRASTAQMSHKNVIVVVVEALRDDVLERRGGNPQIVVEMNRLARDGLLFSAYTQAPETSESSVALLTSLYAYKSAQRDRWRRWEFPHLFIYDLLARIGYRTAVVDEEWRMDRALLSGGHIDFHFDPLSSDVSGFPDELNPRLHSSPYFGNYCLAVADRLKLRVLEDWIARHARDAPLFAFVYFGSSHFPYEQLEQESAPFRPTDLTSDPSFLHYDRDLAPVMRNRYFNTLHYVDSLLAHLVNHLRQLGILRDTILIVTGDHGEAFLEHGHVTHGGYLFEETIRVPLVIYGADQFEPATADPVQLIDISPTILSLLGLPPREDFQGRSIVERAGRDHPPRHAPIFSSVQMLTHEDMVLIWPWKYVENHRSDEARLFNLEDDPGERSNLVGSQAQRRDALQRCLNGFRDSQSTYFAQHSEYPEKFFPPQYDCPP
jgi:arylsulfatase A-like enzyme